MSIVAYTGLPGSGKTYSVVEHQILPALKAGRVVVTNVPLRTEKLAELGLPGEVVEFPVETVAQEPARIRDFVRPGCVFVLDEVWRLFPQGQQANKVPDEFKSLLAEHRHMVDQQGDSVQIVFVVQDLANIGAFARRLVENTFVTTKLGMVGMNKSYRVDIFHGAQSGATPPVSSRLRFITGRYKKEIFALYKSHTMAANDHQDGANETKIDGRANILKRPVFIVGAVLCPILVWYSLHTFSKAFHGVMPKAPSAAATAAQEPPGSRSGAERTGGFFASAGAPRGSLVTTRLLLVQGGAVITEVRSAYLQTPDRLVVLNGPDCRTVNRVWQCRYRGSWYDAAGSLDTDDAGPTDARKPVGAWSAPSAPVPNRGP